MFSPVLSDYFKRVYELRSEVLQDDRFLSLDSAILDELFLKMNEALTISFADHLGRVQSCDLFTPDFPVFEISRS